MNKVCLKIIGLQIFLALAVTNSFAQSDRYTNKLGMEFIRVAPGSMIVGKFNPPYHKPSDTVKAARTKESLIMWVPDNHREYNTAEFKLAEELALRDSRPGFNVTIDKPFFIGKYEVTQEQWKKVMGYNPSIFQEGKVEDADHHPVDNVTWKDVQSFLKKLNKLDPDKTYRLPTEFEWEYAARAGATGDIAWPDIQACAQLEKTTTQAVGLKKPNAWGFYDMLGNVWEWVQDYYNEKIFADPVPTKKGQQHVLKGASISGDVKNATYFTHAGGPGNGWDVGFRVVVELKE